MLFFAGLTYQVGPVQMFMRVPANVWQQLNFWSLAENKGGHTGDESPAHLGR
jgi:hypothetical protein